MKIGVLLATFNGEKYLKEQLDSIFHQTKQVDEIVISDDGSSDNTICIINEYIKMSNSIPIKLVFNREKHGVIYNIENAFRHSSADFLFFCDQDDVWKASKVESFYKALEEFPDYKLYFSNATLTDEKLEPLGQGVWDVYLSYRKFTSEYCVLCGEEFVKKLSFDGNIVTGMSAAVRREVLNEIFPLDPDVLHDEIAAFYCSVNGGLVAINEETAFYRQHTQNIVGLSGSAFVSNDKRRNSILGLIKYSDQNMAIVNSMYYKSKAFLSFDKLQKYPFLKSRYQFYKNKRDISQCNKIAALFRMIGLLFNGEYKRNEISYLKCFILDLAMVLFVGTKKRKKYFSEY